MRRIAPLTASLAVMLTLGLPAMPARAVNFVSFVSGSGSDANNNCANPAAPCRFLVTALANTTAGGEIICLSGGFYGNSTQITQSVTIDCSAGAAVSLGSITVNGPGIVVKLRNLTIDGRGIVGGDAFGINATNMAALIIENCQIMGFSNSGGDPNIGILFTPGDGVAAKLYVSNSVITNNGTATGGGGIIIQPTGSGSARVTIERTRVENNTHGILADGTGGTGSIVVQIDSSIVAGSLGNGIWAKRAGIVVDHTSSKNNAGFGILSDGAGSVVHLSASTVAGNGAGLGAQGGGQLLSYGDNRASGNGFDGAPTGMLALK